MKLLIEWENGSLILEPEYTYILGRDETSDIHIDSPRISRAHARLSFKNKDWILEDLESSNGTFAGNKPVKEIKISKDIVLNLGGIDNYPVRVSVLTSFTSKQALDSQDTRVSKVDLKKGAEINDGINRVRLKKRIRIGRDESNDWVINDLNVSRNHAEVLQNSGGQFEIIDLKSMNGTYVNGIAIRREPLKTGDIIKIGPIEKRFTLDGLESVSGISGTDILVNKVSFEIKGKKLLEDVTFKLGPRTLTAVIGPSGAGKSTLLGVLNGRTKPSNGEVLIGGLNLHENFQIASQRIGLVPQSDILHTNLTVREALNFGARLRLPDDTSREERKIQVDSVLEKLELQERANLRIDKLSGGQRKRASIGLELLTAPDILCLDEPTSGLDPGLDAHVMQTLRSLADDGQTVVVVTHSVDNLEICDNVILMASGGHVAYCGPASSVFSQLGKKSWAEVFRFLASEEAINLATQKHVNPFTTELSEDHLITKNKNAIKQIFTLSHRYLKVIAADRFYTALLFLIPVIIGFIAHIAGSDYGFGKGKTTELGVAVNPYARGSLLVLVLGSVFVGLSTGIQEIVKENQIRIREQAVGIKPASYLVSKLLILGLIVLMQMIVFVQIVLFARPIPESGLLMGNSRIELTLICVALSLSSMVMGLLISSFISSTEQAMPALVGMTMIQVVLSGAMPLESGGLIDKLSVFSPSYWANNALSSSIDLVQISRITDPVQQEHWQASSSNLMYCLWMMAAFMLGFALLSWVKVRKSR